MPITFTVYDEDGNEIEHTLPSRFAVCPTCEGRGTHSHRFGAISGEDFNEWDEDERQAYMSGQYDEVCGKCRGRRVIEVADEARAPKDILKAYREHLRDEADARRESWEERRRECPADFAGSYYYDDGR